MQIDIAKAVEKIQDDAVNSIPVFQDQEPQALEVRLHVSVEEGAALFPAAVA